ncbi:MAG: DMT family transporter [Ruminococcus sp.]|jgi:drug/metabolite transporter (DMT)-like permease|nr:DMT family transporter [Ruminococcus sp.]
MLCILSAAFCFSIMNTCVAAAGDISPFQKAFFRNAIAFTIASFIMIKNKQSFRWKKGSGFPLAIRLVLGTTGLLCNFYAVGTIDLADASMLNKMAPFFTIIFSAIFLHEMANGFQWLMILAAIGGSLFIIKPSFNNPELLPYIIGFIGGVAAGAAYAAIRRLSDNHEKATLIVFYFSAFSCIVTLPSLIFFYEQMSWFQLLMLVLAGISAAGAQFSVTAAYSFAPAKELSVFDYSQVIFTAILGFFIFGEVPDSLSFVGYIIIITSAVVMFFHNKKSPRAYEIRDS